MYQVTRFENGLTIASASMPQMTSVSVGVAIGAGSRGEPAELGGVCHFIEHLLFKGTRKRSAREISQAVEGIGGHLNAYTTEEMTCIHAKACHDRLGEVVEVLVDMVLHSQFDPQEIDKEREVIKEEMAMYFDEPQHHVQELLNATLWPDQPLGRPITGTNQTLDGLDRARLMDYLRQHYVSGSVVVVAAGRLSHDKLLRTVRRFASKFKSGPRMGFLQARDGQREPRVRLFTKKTEQTQIALGIRTTSRHDPRRHALRVLSIILGENMSSRLFQVVREDRGLAYSIYSAPSFFADTGDLVISAGMDTGNVVKTLRLILGELRRLTRSAPGATELRRARDYAIGQIQLGSENTETQMNRLAEHWLSYGGVVRPAQINRYFRQVTATDVRDAARDFFRSERLNLALVSPLKDARPLERVLRI
jgi:predicted Zn-dependent peptidase